MRIYKRAVFIERAVALHASISLFNASKSARSLLLGHFNRYLPIDSAQHWATPEVNLS